MALNLILFLAGMVLSALTLRDVFDTVVVPGGSRASLQVAHRLRIVLLPVWKSIRGRRRGISGAFAPVILVSSFIIWMGLLDLGFGLMTYAVRNHFTPPLQSFGDAIYVAGTALVTVGLSGSSPYGAARWVVLGAGFCGLGVMTMAVTYLLEVQSGVARRDTGILKLNTSAGEPPSALTMLERFAAIGSRRELPDALQEGRNWCATVRQSHSAHPSLLYFQSVGIGAGWPAALGALLDLALIVEMMIDDAELHGAGVLLGMDGMRMARELSALIGLAPKLQEPVDEGFSDLALRLAAAGYPVRPDPDYAEMGRRRAEYKSCVDALADHLGKPTAVLIRKS